MVIIQLDEVTDSRQQEEMRARAKKSDEYGTMEPIWEDASGEPIGCAETYYLEGPGAEIVQFRLDKKEVYYQMSFKLTEEEVHAEMSVEPQG